MPEWNIYIKRNVPMFDSKLHWEWRIISAGRVLLSVDVPRGNPKSNSQSWTEGWSQQALYCRSQARQVGNRFSVVRNKRTHLSCADVMKIMKWTIVLPAHTTSRFTGRDSVLYMHTRCFRTQAIKGSPFTSYLFTNGNVLQDCPMTPHQPPMDTARWNDSGDNYESHRIAGLGYRWRRTKLRELVWTAYFHMRSQIRWGWGAWYMIR